MATAALGRLGAIGRFDEVLASAALLLMTLIPLIEVAARPLMGHGISNAPVLVQAAAGKCVKTHQAQIMPLTVVRAHRFKPKASIRGGLPRYCGHVKHVNSALCLKGVKGFHALNSNDCYY